jgi:hypothetical protein
MSQDRKALDAGRRLRVSGDVVSDEAEIRAPCLADDLLRGADEISEFFFGSRTERRKIYHLAESSRLPVFRMGSVLCARRSRLLAWIEEQERSSVRETTR